MTFCPHCGFNLTQDDPISMGDWVLTPQQARLRGALLSLYKAEAGILYASAKARGRVVSAEAIANRNGSEAEDIRSNVGVQFWNLRRKLGEICPVKHRRGIGYYWDDDLAKSAIPIASVGTNQ